MAEKTQAENVSLPGPAPKQAVSKPAGNPAFRMMGLPNFKWKLPSRNWLIFWTITGSFTATLLYDRYHKKRAQQKWCNYVSHIANEPLSTRTQPRRITIFLAAPPGDTLRAAREHFHEYVKPILVAGALDWDVIEGRREGEVRAGLAEKIRKLRKRNGEKPHIELKEEGPEDESQEQLFYEMRQRAGIQEWDGVQGDLILGRHTWKEYVRGLHEGWLGPLSLQQHPTQSSDPETSSSDRPSPDPSTAAPTEVSLADDTAPTEALKSGNPPEDPPAKPSKPLPTPPYISPAEYSSCSLSPTLDVSLDPSLPLPLPHILGFFNTPTRLYRFLTRRRLAESTGQSVAALVLASQSCPYVQSAEYASAVDPDENSPTTNTNVEPESVALVQETWEQGAVLKQEEEDWHKSAWKENAEGEDRERVWQEPLVIDSRIGQRMRQFELPSGEDEKAVQLDTQKRQEADSIIQQTIKWLGWWKKEGKGWEMGLQGDEND